MYATDRFLYWAEKEIGAKISKETIEEIKQIKGYPYERIDYFLLGDSRSSYAIRYDSIDSNDRKKASLIMNKFRFEIDKYAALISKEEASLILEKIAREHGFNKMRLVSWDMPS